MNQKIKILVVEDDEAVNKLLCRRLEREGYSAEGILSARELLNSMEMGVKADLMLLDYKLHDLDASVVVRELKKMERLPPFIVCTGVGSETIAVTMMKEGARDYLVKDKNFLEALIPTVNKVLQEIDIERKLEEAQYKISYQNAILNAVHELSQDGIVVVDAENKLVSANQRFNDLWNCGEQTIGSDIYDLFTALSEQLKEGSLFLTAMSNVDSAVSPIAQKSHDLEFLNGTYLEAYTTPMSHEDGTYFGRIWYFRDITLQVIARRDIEAAKLGAERSAGLKAEFLANFSHEIRTLLNSLSGFMELLSVSDLSEEQQMYFNSVKLSCANLTSLINNALDLSKLEAGAVIMEELLFDIEETLGNVLIMVDSLKRDKIDLKVEIEDEYLPVIGDSLRLQQVIVNLVSNSLKFTPAGEVVISCSKKDGNIYRFAVKDSGLGIAEDRQKEIFEAFRQESSSTTRTHGGTGLGLSISTRLVKLMGGELRVDSQVGEGATFYFEIPLKGIEE